MSFRRVGPRLTILFIIGLVACQTPSGPGGSRPVPRDASVPFLQATPADGPAVGMFTFSAPPPPPPVAPSPPPGPPTDSEAARAIAERLAAASAHSGEVQVSLAWNDCNDLDLHVIAPSGDEIFFGNRSAAGGALDVDKNAGHCDTEEPVEHVYWPDYQAPSGEYTVVVVLFRKAGFGFGSSRFKVESNVRGTTRMFDGAVGSVGESVRVTTFRVP